MITKTFSLLGLMLSFSSVMAIERSFTHETNPLKSDSNAYQNCLEECSRLWDHKSSSIYYEICGLHCHHIYIEGKINGGPGCLYEELMKTYNPFS